MPTIDGKPRAASWTETERRNSIKKRAWTPIGATGAGALGAMAELTERLRVVEEEVFVAVTAAIGGEWDRGAAAEPLGAGERQITRPCFSSFNS